MSLTIVAKGPEAIAGSIFNFLNTKGRKVEIETPAIIPRNMDKPMILPIR